MHTLAKYEVNMINRSRVIVRKVLFSCILWPLWPLTFDCMARKFHLITVTSICIHQRKKYRGAASDFALQSAWIAPLTQIRRATNLEISRKCRSSDFFTLPAGKPVLLSTGTLSTELATQQQFKELPTCRQNFCSSFLTVKTNTRHWFQHQMEPNTTAIYFL